MLWDKERELKIANREANEEAAQDYLRIAVEEDEIG